MSSWDRIEIQEPHAGRALLGFRYLPGPNRVRGSIYDVLQRLLTELVVMPLIGQGAFDKKVPRPPQAYSG